MNAGLHELPLILFTLLAQIAVGTFIVFTFARFKSEDKFALQYQNKALLIPLILLAVGFVASIAHLGSPLRAFNSLNRVGESMLSNEIATGAIFFITASVYWLLAFKQILSANMEKVLMAITALFGIVFMYMMANVYVIETVPMWNTALTPLAFYLTCVVGGLTLGCALLENQRRDEYSLHLIPAFFSIAVLVIAISVMYQAVILGQLNANLLSDFAPMQALRLCLLGVAAALIWKCKSSVSLGTAFILTLAAEFIGRTLFYGTHFTVGL